jgi:hypothetical protein
MTVPRRSMLVVKVVTLHSILVKESWNPILSEADGVACIIIHNPAFRIDFNLTTTPKHVLPVHVQQGNIPMDSMTERNFDLLQGVCAYFLSISSKDMIVVKVVATLESTSSEESCIESDDDSVACIVVQNRGKNVRTVTLQHLLLIRGLLRRKELAFSVVPVVP